MNLGSMGRSGVNHTSSIICVRIDFSGFNTNDSLQGVFITAQHYLLHLLRAKLVSSHSRVVFVSSGSLRTFNDIDSLEQTVEAQSGAGFFSLYPATKFIQLLSAHWWRRQLRGECNVLAVSPGLYLPRVICLHGADTLLGFIPSTGLSRNVDLVVPPEIMKDAKSVEEGKHDILQAIDDRD